MMILHLHSELSCSYGDNNGSKTLFQNRILLLIHSLIAPISNLTLKYYCNYLPRYQLFSSTPERTFSVLNRLKNYLRSTMSENRLNGLAMANINKKEQFDESEVITEFVQNSLKRMQLSEWSK